MLGRVGCIRLLHSVTVFLFIHFPIVPAEEVSIKIVDEPTNYGMNFGGGGGYQENHAADSTLRMRVKPSNFSGPPHLHPLQGKCFSRVDDTYKYEFCPFVNITQHEQSLRWNPYSGVIGVWQEWEIENNTFVAMLMTEGDSCGGMHRTMRILPSCGEKNEIEKVSEPTTCHYQMTFKTPLVCHPHSLLVYPTLSEHLQGDWDLIEAQFSSGYLTKKGYKKRLTKVFEQAGYVLPHLQREQVSKEAKHREQQAIQDGQDSDFESLTKCSEEYKKLKHEVDELKALLAVHGITNSSTLKPGHSTGPPSQSLVEMDDLGVHQMEIGDLSSREEHDYD